MKKIYFLLLTLTSTFVFAQSNITFSVDMTGQTFTQAYVSGGFNTWSGEANPLTDMGGGLWSVTLPIPDGEHEYKFTFDNWTGQENFTQGDVCTITNYGNHNRRLVVAGADQTLTTPVFGTCYESTVNPGPHEVTLTVDMSSYTGTLGTVYLNGENHNSQGLGNWCGSCGNELTDMGGGIWSRTITIEEFAYQFKFTVDAWTDQESFSPGDQETATDGTNTNRYLKLDGPKTVNYIWNQPMVLGTSDFEVTEFSVYPNPAKDAWNIKANAQTINRVEVFDILGKSVMSLKPESNEVKLDASNLLSGLYFARLSSESGTKSIKLIKE